MPPAPLRRVDTSDELEVLFGHLAAESNRIRGRSPRSIPPCDVSSDRNRQRHRAGAAADQPGYARPDAALVAGRAPRMGPPLVEVVLTALDERRVTVPGTTAAETVLPRPADNWNLT